MYDHPERISIDSCVEGHVYRLCSRNLDFGVCVKHNPGKYNGKFTMGFIGIRTKWGNRYLFEEYHWDCGSPFGTANPLEDVGKIPDDVEIVESYYKDEITGRAIEFDNTPIPGEYLYPPTDKNPNPPLKRKGYYFADTNDYSKDIQPVSEINQKLFEFLEQFSE